MIIQKPSSANCSQVPNQEETLPLVETAEAVSLAINSTDFPSSDLGYINNMPKEVLSLVFKFTESYPAESLVSKKFNKSAEDQACFFFHELFSMIGGDDTFGDISTFERLINAKVEDSYSEKIKKAIQYLNDIRLRLGLDPIELPKKNEEGEDIYSINLLSLYRKPFSLMNEILEKLRKPTSIREVLSRFDALNIELFVRNIAYCEGSQEDQARIQEIKQAFYKLISEDPNFINFQTQLVEVIKALRNHQFALETFAEIDWDLVEFTQCLNNLETYFADHCALLLGESNNLLEYLREFASMINNPEFNEYGVLIQYSTEGVCEAFNIYGPPSNSTTEKIDRESFLEFLKWNSTKAVCKAFNISKLDCPLSDPEEIDEESFLEFLKCNSTEEDCEAFNADLLDDSLSNTTTELIKKYFPEFQK